MSNLIKVDAGGLKGGLALDYDRAKDILTGTLMVPRRGGKPYVTTIVVHLGEIRKQATSLLSNRTGWSLKGAKRALKRSTNKAAMTKMLRTVDAIMNDPRFKAGILVASTFFPPLGITYATIQQGADIVKKAQAGDQQSQATLLAVSQMAAAQTGDPSAAASLQGLMGLAQGGNPNAIAVVNNVNTMTENGKVPPGTLLQGLRAIALAQEQGRDPAATVQQMASAVAGWFYEKQYRSPLKAGEIDPTNPRHILRAWYHKGLEMEKRGIPKKDIRDFFKR